jgi:hypothetical protein
LIEGRGDLRLTKHLTYSTSVRRLSVATELLDRGEQEVSEKPFAWDEATAEDHQLFIDVLRQIAE